MKRLSIIIPTKDRYDYLLPLIELLDSYALDNCELVIEDNSSENSRVLDFLKGREFKTEIIYNYTSEPLPISDNLDNAINHSNGKYVCLIGDDDAVTPLIKDCLDIMDESDADSFRQAEELTYKWPTYTDNNYAFIGGSLAFGPINNTFKAVDTSSEAINIIKRGIRSLGNMPCVYQGIVRRSTLDRLKSIGGTYFPGPSPDMANAMALSFVVDKHIVGNMPVIISGGSEYQGGRNRQDKSIVRPLDKVPFISDASKNKWDKRLPFFWCVFTVWPESGIKGLEYVRQESLLSYMDFDLLLAKCMYTGGLKFRDEVLSRTTKKGRVILLWLLFSLREYLAKYKRRLLKAMHKTSGDRKIVFGIETISKAKDYLLNLYTI